MTTPSFLSLWEFQVKRGPDKLTGWLPYADAAAIVETYRAKGVFDVWACGRMKSKVVTMPADFPNTESVKKILQGEPLCDWCGTTCKEGERFCDPECAKFLNAQE